MSKIAVGIDPGTYGGIVVASRDRVHYACATPLKTTTKNRRKIKVIDTKELSAVFGHIYMVYEVGGVFIEEVHSMPQQGVASTFTFGYNYGCVCQGAEILEVPIVLVRPGIWKASYSITADKGESLRVANTVFDDPSSKDYWNQPRRKKQNEGISEAALIALFGVNRLERY